MTTELWKPIIELDGLYSASNNGRIRKEPHKVFYGDHRSYREVPQQLKKQTIRPSGYHVVRVTTNDKSCNMSVHRLVAWAFIGKQDKGIEVRHIDGNKSNNKADNLCYGTKSDNMRDAIVHRTFSMSEWHPCAKLTNEQVKEIRDSKENYKLIAKKFGIHPHTVHKIRSMTRRKHDLLV